MEESSGNARGDRNQITLADEDFDLAGAGEFGKIHCPPGADAGGRQLVGGHARKLGQEFAGMNEQFKQWLKDAVCVLSFCCWNMVR